MKICESSDVQRSMFSPMSRGTAPTPSPPHPPPSPPNSSRFYQQKWIVLRANNSGEKGANMDAAGQTVKDISVFHGRRNPGLRWLLDGYRAAPLSFSAPHSGRPEHKRRCAADLESPCEARATDTARLGTKTGSAPVVHKADFLTAHPHTLSPCGPLRHKPLTRSPQAEGGIADEENPLAASNRVPAVAKLCYVIT